MSYGNISAVLSNANKQNIKDRVADILALLPFLVNLTAEERRNLQMVGRKKRFAFVQQTILHAKDNLQVFPSYFSVDELEKDFELYKDLQEIEAVLVQLLEQVSGTKLAAGNEAYMAALQAKGLFTEAHRNEPGLIAVVSELEEYFRQASKEDDSAAESDDASAPEMPEAE